MTSRRRFLKSISMAGTAGWLLSAARMTSARSLTGPLILSTWDFGMEANARALQVLQSGGSATDAVEQGVIVTESDPRNQSVGLGGLPDRDGHVTLDACIMDENGNAGSVTFLEGIAHPVSVARLVMETTPHVMLSGAGALAFARRHGFDMNKGMTPEARKEWNEWKEKNNYKQISDKNNHDTIGMILLTAGGKLAGACTTSGLAFKMHGRVGDSPIIGAGLYVEPDIGAATATGLGEAVIKICGSHTIVELMRRGASPQEACEEAVARIRKRETKLDDMQVGFLALNQKGETGAYAIRKDFKYAIVKEGKSALMDSSYLLS